LSSTKEKREKLKKEIFQAKFKKSESESERKKMGNFEKATWSS
jgi:hypothetical protein